LCGTPGTPDCPGELLTSYYLNAGDNLELIAPFGGYVNYPQPLTYPTLCVMIYVFDSQENMGECCGCPISPQGLLSLNVNNNLTLNWPGGLAARPPSGAIDIISAAINVFNVSPVSECSPSTSFHATRELNGYVLHESRLSEAPIADAGDPDSTTQSSLISKCASLTKAGNVCSCSSGLPFEQ
jgi:hypothetical protein